MGAYNLIVKDDEIETASNRISNLLHLGETAIGQYRQILTQLSGDAVVSGKVHEALIAYDEYIEKIETAIMQLGESLTTLTNRYVSELESADSYLYDAGIPDTVRDFSEDQYKRLVACLDDPWCDFTDSIGDFFYGIADSAVNLINWGSAKKYLNNCHSSLLDYNDETLQGLTLMFDEVHAIDNRYGNQGGNGNAGSLISILETAEYLSEVIAEMAAIISPKSDVPFTAANIRSHLGGKFAELQKRLEKTVEIASSGSIPDVGQISDFVSQPWAWSYFNGFSQACSMFLGDIGFWDTAGMVVFNMFDIFDDVAVHTGDGTSYAQRQLKEELLELLEKMGTEPLYEGTEYEDTVSECRLFLKYFKKYGNETYKWMNEHRLENGKLILDGRTVEAKRFKDFLDSLGHAGDILKYGEEGIEYIARLFTDYEKANEILNSFAINCSDPDMLQAAGEIQTLFNKEFCAWVKEAGDQIKELGWDAAMSLFYKSCPVGKVIGTIRDTLDIGGEITGAGTHAKNSLAAMTYINIYYSSSAAYSSAIAKLREADPNSEEYETLCKDAYNCFELTRNNMVKMFNTMEAASSGDKSAYYRYCARQAEKLSMSELTEPDIMSYEEFLSVSHDVGSSGNAYSMGGGRHG